MKLINITKKINDKLILNNINLEIIKSGLVFIKGQSGSGKTTLLNIISSIDKQTSGNIEDNNYKITYLYQDNNLIENLTVKENLEIYSDKSIDDYLKKLKIYHLKNQKIKNISTGEKRRVALARTLLKDSNLIILDEPNTNLDEDNNTNIFELLKELSKEKLIICTLHRSDNFDYLADQIIKINEGSIEENIIINKNNTLQKVKENRINKKYLKNISKYIFSEISFVHVILIIILLTTYFIINIIGNLNFIEIESDTLEKENNHKILFSYNQDIDNKVKTKIYVDGSKYVSLSLSQKDTPKNYYLYTPVNYFYYYNELDEEIIGLEPKNYNEIMISEILAEKIVFNGVLDTNEKIINFKTKEEIINQTINLSGIPVKITGIVKQDLKKYEMLKDYELWNYNQSQKGKLIYDELNFLNEIEYFSNFIYVKESFDNYITNYFSENTIPISIPTYVKLSNKEKIRDNLIKAREYIPKITLRNIENNDLTTGTIHSLSISNYLKKYYKTYLVLIFFTPIIIILLLIEINVIYQLILKKNKKELLLLKSLGINNKEITTTINNSVVYSVLISLLSSIVLSIAISIILNELATRTVGFYLKPFSIDIISTIILLFIIFLLILLGKVILSNKLNKIELNQLRNI